MHSTIETSVPNGIKSTAKHDRRRHVAKNSPNAPHVDMLGPWWCNGRAFTYQTGGNGFEPQQGAVIHLGDQMLVGVTLQIGTLVKVYPLKVKSSNPGLIPGHRVFRMWYQALPHDLLYSGMIMRSNSP